MEGVSRADGMANIEDSVRECFKSLHKNRDNLNKIFCDDERKVAYAQNLAEYGTLYTLITLINSHGPAVVPDKECTFFLSELAHWPARVERDFPYVSWVDDIQKRAACYNETQQQFKSALHYLTIMSVIQSNLQAADSSLERAATINDNVEDALVQVDLLIVQHGIDIVPEEHREYIVAVSKGKEYTWLSDLRALIPQPQPVEADAVVSFGNLWRKLTGQSIAVPEPEGVAGDTKLPSAGADQLRTELVSQKAPPPVAKTNLDQGQRNEASPKLRM